MNPFEDFRQQLQHVLPHLNDPDYKISHELCWSILCSEDVSPCLSAFQSVVIEAIKALKSSSETALGSRAMLTYQILNERYILGRTQEQAAESLNLSIRSLQRLQREATHILARYLWTYCHPNEAVSDPKVDHEITAENPFEWSSQLKHELLLLQSQSPHAECALDEAIAGALRIVQAITSEAFQIDFSKELFKVTVQFHPSVLRQVFVHLLSECIRTIPAGKVSFEAQASPGWFTVLVTAAPIQEQVQHEFPLAVELLASQGGVMEIGYQGQTVAVKIELQQVKKKHPIPVLIVDDNTDLVTLYQSYCAGTLFQIYHLRESKRIFEEIKAIQPEIIMLDILLPDSDGWDLLLNLHANPETKSIPVIICSVISNERLVHDLGAALYLRKPIWREQMLSSFEQILYQKKALEN